MHLQPARLPFGPRKKERSIKFLKILDDLSLCSGDNDNNMIFVGHIVYLCPRSIICTLAGLERK